MVIPLLKLKDSCILNMKRLKGGDVNYVPEKNGAVQKPQKFPKRCKEFQEEHSRFSNARRVPYLKILPSRGCYGTIHVI